MQHGMSIDSNDKALGRNTQGSTQAQKQANALVEVSWLGSRGLVSVCSDLPGNF